MMETFDPTPKVNQNWLSHDNVLFVPDTSEIDQFDKAEMAEQLAKEHQHLVDNFCGTIIRNEQDLTPFLSKECIICLTGYISSHIQSMIMLNDMPLFWIVKEYSSGDYEPLLLGTDRVRVVGKGKLPLNMFGVGVLFRHFFESDKDYFKSIASEHTFQSMTESNKEGVALRRAIYLSHVAQEQTKDGQVLTFNLLRCSSNLEGPTDNLRATDQEIVGETNQVVPYFLPQCAKVNHILAQVYHNKRDPSSTKETKAAIKRHSDKTKDMPRNAVIGFATFYDFGELPVSCRAGDTSGVEGKDYDVCYKHTKTSGATSMLTQLELVLKNPFEYPYLQRKFRVTLYPNSLFVIPHAANRLYTHQIKPSVLPVNKIPTRLGYVMRCSETRATFRDSQTYITIDGKEQALQPMTPEEMVAIKELYRLENATDQDVTYPPFCSSMNRGDFMQPML